MMYVELISKVCQVYGQTSCLKGASEAVARALE